MENFKSFGRTLSVPLLKGFTAITGPNGSGKSNIADAILFVLGPRSNRLIRAGRLTDLIYNGGPHKRGASHLKVALVFDNADRKIPFEDDEVTLTRLVKKSQNEQGYNSYFYVNGRPATQTDFERLLMHANISADGYNIVQQGDVTNIVKMTALERRRLLDDVAGVTRFDSDIDSANKKRGDVEANLDRIKLLLGEITSTLSTLERQREQAMKYRDLKRELETARAKFAHKRKEAQEQELAGARQRIAALETEMAALARREAELKGDLAEAETKLAEVSERLAAVGGEEAKELNEKIRDLQARAETELQKANYFRGEEVPLHRKEQKEKEQDLARQEKLLAKLAKDLAKLADDLEKARAKAAAKDQALEELKERIASSSDAGQGIHRELAKLRKEWDEKSDEIKNVRLAEDRAKDRTERARAQVATLEDAVESTELEVKSVRYELKEFSKETKDVGASAEELTKRHFALKKEEAGLSKESHEIEQLVRKLAAEYHRLKVEQDHSAALRQGGTRAVSAVLEARDTGQLKGVCGTIAELGRATDPKFETALEIAAGGRMQAVVVETDHDAAQAIDFLKRGRLGRATFLPLNKMTASRPAGKPLLTVRQNGALGFAVDLLQHDARFKAAFAYVFRDTIVVDGLDTARRLMGGVRLVTLDGDLIDAGGAMTGGVSAKEAAGPKFGQGMAREYEAAGKKLREANASQDDLVRRLGEVRDELRVVEQGLGEARLSQGSKGTRVTELTTKLKEYETRLTTAKEELEARQKDLAAGGRELATLGERAEGVERDLAALTSRRDELQKALLASTDKKLADELERMRTEVEGLKEAARGLEAQALQREGEKGFVVERIDELKRTIAKLGETLATRERDIAGLTASAGKLKGELDVLLAAEAKVSEQNKELLAEKDEAYARKLRLANDLEKVRDQAGNKQDVLLNTEASIPKAEDTLREVEAELATVTVTVEIPVQEPLDELKSAFRDIERKVAGIGDINMTAIEEYDAQDKRRRELEEKEEHLKAQREELMKLVEEITEKKTTALLEVFTEINENFKHVYANLTRGGIAELKLENEKRPFEGGLVMKAQPEGKKVLSINALSGGEKSLTTLAFIVAIQQYDPSPFYVFDEVDQNLDAVNCELIASLIRESSDRAQFLVISLRKVTLKEADHVYGVTMNKATGISEMVGEVNVKEAPEAVAP